MQSKPDPVQQSRGSGAVLYVLIPLIVLFTFVSAILFPFWTDTPSVSERLAECAVLEHSLALREAGDGEYLIHALLRGSEVLYDDNGRAVVYLEEKRHDKNGNDSYERLFTAEQFYLDDIAVPVPELKQLYYPEFSGQYGTKTYRGCYHCGQGTFLVTKQAGAYSHVVYYCGMLPDSVMNLYGNSSPLGQWLWLIPVIVDVVLIALLVDWLRRRMAWVCPRCGRRLKKNQQCPNCLTDAVRPEKKKEEKPPAPKKAPEPMPEKARKKRRWEVIVSGLVVLFLVMGLIGSIRREQRIAASGVPETYAFRPIVPEDVYNGYPYAYVDELGHGDYYRSGGEQATLSLSGGSYIVGVHIPAGRYRAEPEDDFDVLMVTDFANRIYLYEYAAKEGNHMDDLLLLTGALVEVQTATEMTLCGEHVWEGGTRSVANPLTAAVDVRADSSMTAGAGFQPGVYDLHFAAGEYTVSVTIDDPHSEEDIIRQFTQSGDDEAVWKNMVLPEGARVETAGGPLTMTPSPRIFSTCYQAYYEMYP